MSCLGAWMGPQASAGWVPLSIPLRTPTFCYLTPGVLPQGSILHQHKDPSCTQVFENVGPIYLIYSLYCQMYNLLAHMTQCSSVLLEHISIPYQIYGLLYWQVGSHQRQVASLSDQVTRTCLRCVTNACLQSKIFNFYSFNSLTIRN